MVVREKRASNLRSVLKACVRTVHVTNRTVTDVSCRLTISQWGIVSESLPRHPPQHLLDPSSSLQLAHLTLNLTRNRLLAVVAQLVLLPLHEVDHARGDLVEGSHDDQTTGLDLTCARARHEASAEQRKSDGRAPAKKERVTSRRRRREGS